MSRESRQLIDRVRRVLLTHWDPIGVRVHREAADEYDAYAPRIAAMVASRCSSDDLERHLATIETQDMGLPARPSSSRASAIRALLGSDAPANAALMRLHAPGGDFFELLAERDQPDDIVLVARCAFSGFTGETETWVRRDAWLRFVGELVDLEQRRKGTAELHSISPGELSVTLRSIDSAGHLGVEGRLGIRSFREVGLQFSLLEFDPSQLLAFVKTATTVVEDDPSSNL